jgi:hypothetical protein
VQLQVELHDGLDSTRAFLDPHVAFFTFGENLGRAGCGLPVPLGYDFRPTRQPVVLDHWPAAAPVGGDFTTIGNWRQSWREVRLDGEVYGWSKHTQFGALLELPGPLPAGPAGAGAVQLLGRRAGRAAPSGLLGPRRPAAVPRARPVPRLHRRQPGRAHGGQGPERAAAQRLVQRPQRHLPGQRPTGDHPGHRLRPGAADRRRPARLAHARRRRRRGRGGAGDPVGQSRAAREIAEECFDSDRVLGRLLDVLGLPVRAPGSLATAREPGAGAASRLAAGPVAAAPSVPTASVPTASVRAVAVPALPADLPLHAVSRRPLVLPERTLATARSLRWSVPAPGADRGSTGRPTRRHGRRQRGRRLPR